MKYIKESFWDWLGKDKDDSPTIPMPPGRSVDQRYSDLGLVTYDQAYIPVKDKYEATGPARWVRPEEPWPLTARPNELCRKVYYRDPDTLEMLLISKIYMRLNRTGDPLYFMDFYWYEHESSPSGENFTGPLPVRLDGDKKIYDELHDDINNELNRMAKIPGRRPIAFLRIGDKRDLKTILKMPELSWKQRTATGRRRQKQIDDARYRA